MLPEKIVLRLYGSLIKNINLTRAILFFAVIFYWNNEAWLYFGSIPIVDSLGVFLKTVKGFVLDSKLYALVLAYGLSFWVLPLFNQILLSRVAKFWLKYTKELEIVVNRRLEDPNLVVVSDIVEQDARLAQNKIGNIYSFLEFLSAVLLYVAVITCIDFSLEKLVVFAVILLLLVFLSFFGVQKILISYIEKVYFHNELIKRRRLPIA